MKRILIILIIIAYFYLVYQVFEVFGFWTILWTNILLIISGSFLGKLASGRQEGANEILYNPKEFPKFINILLSLGVGYYLYTIISKPEVSSSDYTFGIWYLALTVGLTGSYAIYRLIRDRNDFVSISATTLKYQDNANQGEYKLNEISSADLESTNLILKLSNGSSVTIALAKMNFSLSDIAGLMVDLQARLPKTAPQTENAPAAGESAGESAGA